MVLVYIYLTQDRQVFNFSAIELKEPFDLVDTQRISLEMDEITLRGVYKTSQDSHAKLILYFGGNADDATRVLLHTKNLKEFDIVAFNYRGFVDSEGAPSEKAMFSDALKIYDKFSKDREVIVIGRSLGTGVATYVASKRDVNGLILITPFDSILHMAQTKHPYFFMKALLKHRFESVKYMPSVRSKVGLIEVSNDEIIPFENFDKLKDSVVNLALHVELQNTTHKEVLTHRDFEKTIREMIDAM